FYGYRPPRALHSFPTRRSSDLVGEVRWAPTGAAAPVDLLVRLAELDEVVVVRRHDAPPVGRPDQDEHGARAALVPGVQVGEHPLDRKSTRLNSSHVKISYAVFC